LIKSRKRDKNELEASSSPLRIKKRLCKEEWREPTGKSKLPTMQLLKTRTQKRRKSDRC